MMKTQAAKLLLEMVVQRLQLSMICKYFMIRDLKAECRQEGNIGKPEQSGKHGVSSCSFNTSGSQSQPSNGYTLKIQEPRDSLPQHEDSNNQELEIRPYPLECPILPLQKQRVYLTVCFKLKLREKQLKLLAQIMNSVNTRFPPSKKFEDPLQNRKWSRKRSFCKQLQKMINERYVPLRILYPDQAVSEYEKRLQKLTLKQKKWEAQYFFQSEQFNQKYNQQQERLHDCVEKAMLFHQTEDIYRQVKELLQLKERDKLYNRTFTKEWHYYRDKYCWYWLSQFDLWLRQLMEADHIPNLAIEHITGCGNHSVNKPKLITTFQQWVTISQQKGKISACWPKNKGSFIATHMFSKLKHQI